MSRYEDSVAAKIQQRAEHGLRKYGVTVERTDLEDLDWLRHAQEEAMDLCVYLERLIQDREEKRIKEETLRAIGYCGACPHASICLAEEQCRGGPYWYRLRSRVAAVLRGVQS